MVGINLSDVQYSGIYHGKQVHEPDHDKVIERAQFLGVDKMLVTSSYLNEAKEVVDLCKRWPGLLYSTVGVHPCHALDVSKDGIDPANYYSELGSVAKKGKADGVVRAWGEIGLDYDRLHYAPADVQREVFQSQLDLAVSLNLDMPLFLHSRAAAKDFGEILFPYLESGKLSRSGVVHSFTGSVAEMQELVSKGLYIGINGCSLKTEENLEVVKEVPLDRLMLETDGPWCEIRPSHASFKLHLQVREDAKVKKPAELLPFETVKKEKFQPGKMVTGRCEPCAIGLVAKVVAHLKGISEKEVADAAWKNTMYLFDME